MTSIPTLRTIADDLDRAVQEINCPHTRVVIREDYIWGVSFVEITLNLPGNTRRYRVEIDTLFDRTVIDGGAIRLTLYGVEEYLKYCRDAFDLPFDRIPLHLNDPWYEQEILISRLKGYI